jgi:RNA polymerase sigma factor (sigma-70 family)
MKKEGADYPSPMDDTSYYDMQAKRQPEVEENQLDELFRTVRCEMQSRKPNDQSAHSRELEEAIERIFILVAPRIYRSALSELMKYGHHLTLEAQDIEFLAYGELNAFLLEVLPSPKFIYNGPKKAISYVCTSARNKVKDLRKRRCTYLEVSFDQLQENGFDRGAEDVGIIQAESDKLPVDVVMGMAKLTEREMIVMNLNVEEGLKPRDIAKLTGVKPQRVSRIIDRAKTKLRKVIKRNRDGDWELR